MEELKKIIQNCCVGIDVEDTAVKFVTDGIIDSIDLVAVISDIEEEFGVDIAMKDIVPENFDSMEAIWNLIQRLS
jgi:acyl carrier protein